MPPEARLRIGGCDLLLLGTIAGYVPDGERVQAAFAEQKPDVVALGVPPEDLAALERLRAAPKEARDLVPPDLPMVRLLELLQRFGAIRLPSPDLEAAFGLAREHGVEVQLVDLDDASHAEQYLQRVKVRHLWWAPRREKALMKREFAEATDPYALAIEWDRALHASKPLRQMERLREEAMANGLRAAAARAVHVLAVLPVARLEGVAGLLRASAGTDIATA